MGEGVSDCSVGGVNTCRRSRGDDAGGKPEGRRAWGAAPPTAPPQSNCSIRHAAAAAALPPPPLPLPHHISLAPAAPRLPGCAVHGRPRQRSGSHIKHSHGGRRGRRGSARAPAMLQADPHAAGVGFDAGAAPRPRRRSGSGVVRACSSLTLGSGAAALASSARTTTAARREGRWLLTRVEPTSCTRTDCAHCILVLCWAGGGQRRVRAAAAGSGGRPSPAIWAYPPSMQGRGGENLQVPAPVWTAHPSIQINGGLRRRPGLPALPQPRPPVTRSSRPCPPCQTRARTWNWQDGSKLLHARAPGADSQTGGAVGRGAAALWSLRSVLWHRGFNQTPSTLHGARPQRLHA